MPDFNRLKNFLKFNNLWIFLFWWWWHQHYNKKKRSLLNLLLSSLIFNFKFLSKMHSNFLYWWLWFIFIYLFIYLFIIHSFIFPSGGGGGSKATQSVTPVYCNNKSHFERLKEEICPIGMITKGFKLPSTDSNNSPVPQEKWCCIWHRV